MKALFTLVLFSCFTVFINAQCVLDIEVTVDGSGNIVTTNNSTGADPSTYTWYVYHESSPWMAEYLEMANTITYAPLEIGEYNVCLIGTEPQGNIACDSVCEPVVYTQAMMSLQNTNTIEKIEVSKTKNYPNPTNDKLFVLDKSLQSNGQFSVSDISGKLYEIPFSKSTLGVELDVTLLPNGVYFLLLKERNEVIKFAVQ